MTADRNPGRGRGNANWRTGADEPPEAPVEHCKEPAYANPCIREIALLRSNSSDVSLCSGREPTQRYHQWSAGLGRSRATPTTWKTPMWLRPFLADSAHTRSKRPVLPPSRMAAAAIGRAAGRRPCLADRTTPPRRRTRHALLRTYSDETRGGQHGRQSGRDQRETALRPVHRQLRSVLPIEAGRQHPELKSNVRQG